VPCSTAGCRISRHFAAGDDAVIGQLAGMGGVARAEKSRIRAFPPDARRYRSDGFIFRVGSNRLRASRAAFCFFEVVMKPLTRSAQRSDWYPPFSAGVLLYAVGRAFERSLGAAQSYLGERRKAAAAEELYRHLAGLSDAELARRGLDRHQLAHVVREHFY
jgi:hypothetical protein